MSMDVRGDTLPAGFEEIRALEDAGALTPTSLRLGREMTFEQFASLALAFGTVTMRCRWYIGDLINYGEKVFPERYLQAVDLTGLSKSRLRVYSWVCRQVSWERRVEELSFGHHEIVAALDPAGQRAWLRRAEEHGWTRSKLRAELDAAAVLPPRPPGGAWTVTKEDRAALDAVAVRKHTPGAPTATLTARNGQAEVLPHRAFVSLQDAARAVLESAYGGTDGYWLVPDATFQGLSAALDT